MPFQKEKARNTMENNTNGNVFAKYPALKGLIGIAVIAVILLGVQTLRDSGRLGGKNSSAGCYGYQCTPEVSIGARIKTTGYGVPFSYGTLNIAEGQAIELTWFGINVDRCKADWTSFQGTYLQPTFYGAVKEARKFTVTCYRGGQQVSNGVFVNVLRTSSGGSTKTDSMIKAPASDVPTQRIKQ